MQPTILVLKEGTENAQGTEQVVSNINACSAIVDAIRTTLGPRGMDKLIVDARGKATISNDGATIMKLLDVVHPAAKKAGRAVERLIARETGPLSDAAWATLSWLLGNLVGLPTML